MIYTDIDSVVRSALFDEGVTIHYYLQFLHWGLDCIQEMSYDIPNVTRDVKAVRLTVGADKAITIPEDYVDWVKVGIQKQGYIRPLSVNNSINRLENDQTTSGAYSGSDTDNDMPWGVYFWGSHISNNGEHLGGFFGNGGGIYKKSFKVVPERGEIQLDQSFAQGDVIVLEYLSQTASSTTATVHPYAVNAVKAFISWRFRSMKTKRFGRLDGQNKEREYQREYRAARARSYQWDIPGLMRAIRRHYSQAPKT